MLVIILMMFSVFSFGAAITINTNNNRQAISPLIYGTNQQMEGDENLTTMRLGGNRMTAYNWENNASNAGADWFHSSDTYMCSAIEYPLSATECASSASGVVDHFVEYSKNHGYVPIVTLPMSGYVAADKLGDVLAAEAAPSARWKIQQPKKGSAFQYPPNPADNYVYDDEQVWHLVQKYGTSAAGGVRIYELDNEADLWDSTHLRIHPTAVGAAEWVTKGVALSKAIKDVDAGAEVFGPVFFGVWSMLSQGADWNAVKGSHQWYASYYLDQMKQASDADGGRRLLDAIDIHYYSEAREGLYPPFNYSSGQCRITEDACTSALAQQSRLQAPRALWDPAFTENSSVGQWATTALPLIPKVQAAINAYYPGTKIAFTEHAFGGGNDYSGGIATADSLGIFGKYGVYVATLWKTAYGLFHSAAYKLFRNYNGINGTYGDTKVYCESDDITNMTTYASINGTDDSVVHLIVLNKASTAQTANASITSPVSYTQGEAWAFGGASPAITLRTAPVIAGNSFSYLVPAQSAFHFILRVGGTPTNTPDVTNTPTPTITVTMTITPDWTETTTSTRTPTFTVTVAPALEMIDDMEDGDLNILVNNGRQGPWYELGDGTGSEWLRTQGPGSGAGSYAIHVTGTGYTSWGSGFGFNFSNPGAGAQQYDVSAYSGIRFWAKVDAGSTAAMRIVLPNNQTLPEGGMCGADCYNHFGFDITLTTSWQLFTMPFSSMSQQTGWGVTYSAIDLTKVYNFETRFTTNVTYSVWMDDIEFYGGPTPSMTRTWTVEQTPTYTRTVTHTFTHTVTNTATQTWTRTLTKTQTPDYSATETPTGSVTMTATLTLTNTVVYSVTHTPTFTETLTPAATVQTGEEIAYPNPVNPDVRDLQLGINFVSAATSVKFLVYTRGFRLVKSVELGASPAGFFIKPVSRTNLQDLSAGMYLYVIKQANSAGTESKSRIRTFIIIR